MAVAYPEGECFFMRKGLCTSQDDGYRATDAQKFYSHFMLEYIWNIEADHASRNCNSGKGWTHPRSGYKIVQGEWWDTDYGCWENLPFTYGPRTAVTGRMEHNLCTNGNTFRDFEKGASAKPYFMTMPMPTRTERWIWIDLLGYIRGLYIPVCYSSSPDYPEISTWMQINFALDRTVEIWRDDTSTFEKMTFDSVKGLGIHRDLTIGFDLYGIVQLLSLPRQLRNSNVFSSKLVKIVKPDQVKFPTGGSWRGMYVNPFKDSYDLEYTKVLKANCGLDLQWKPPSETWEANFIKNSLTLAIGFIPGVGPILQASFIVGWALVTDPDSVEDTLRNLAPGIDLAAKLIEEIKISATETSQYLPEGLESLDLTAKSTIKGGGKSGGKGGGKGGKGGGKAMAASTAAPHEEVALSAVSDDEAAPAASVALETPEVVAAVDDEDSDEDFEEMETSPALLAAKALLDRTGTVSSGDKNVVAGSTVVVENKATGDEVTGDEEDWEE